MPKGVIGESGADRATDKMDKWVSRSTSSINKPMTYWNSLSITIQRHGKKKLKKQKQNMKRVKRLVNGYRDLILVIAWFTFVGILALFLG